MLVAALIGPVAPPAGAVTERVTLADMRFNPARLEIALGDAVVWQADDDDHTVTARDGTFDSSARGLMGQGDEFRYRFWIIHDGIPAFARFEGPLHLMGPVWRIEVLSPSMAGSPTDKPHS